MEVGGAPGVPARLDGRDARRSTQTQHSEKMVQNQRLKAFYAFKDGIVRNQTGSLRMYGGRGLKSIGSSQAMKSANPRRQIRDLQVRSNPLQVGVGGKQAIEVICPLFVAFAIRQYEQFRHRY